MLSRIVRCSALQSVVRHDICQIVYAAAILGARILRRKRVNRDISQFSTKARKCFEMAKFALLCVRIKET